MDRSDPPDASPGEDRCSPNAGARDAAKANARAAAEQAAADDARVRYRREGLPTLRPDSQIGPLLAPWERLIAVRQAALLDRREPSPGVRATGGVGGVLYLTSARLVLVGRLTLSLDLATIEDVVVSGDRLLLTLRDGRGVSLQVGWPRLLAVEIAAARSAGKSESTAAPDPVGQPASR